MASFSNVVILSRHSGVVEWLRKYGPEMCVDARVISGNAIPQDVEGKVVIGVLPMHLAALADEVYVIEFSGTPPRGKEYSLEEMESNGAYLARYTVLQITPSVDPVAGPTIGVTVAVRWRNPGDDFPATFSSDVEVFIGHLPPSQIGAELIKRGHGSPRATVDERRWAPEEVKAVAVRLTWDDGDGTQEKQVWTIIYK